MATITIKIDDKSISGKRFLEFLKTLSFVSIISNDNQNGIDKALEDVKKGHVHQAKNAKDLMRKTSKYFKLSH